MLGPAVVVAQGVSEKIAPTVIGAAGCEPSTAGKFVIASVDAEERLHRGQHCLGIFPIPRSQPGVKKRPLSGH